METLENKISENAIILESNAINYPNQIYKNKHKDLVYRGQTYRPLNQPYNKNKKIKRFYC